MPIPWLRMQRMMDSIIDDTWAEPFEIHPWTTAGYAGRGGPDPSRAALIGPNVIGVYTTPGSKVMGETADSPATQTVENEVWLAVEQTVLIDPSIWVPSDRVFLPDRGEWYEISYVAPSSTFRPNIHLTRLQNVDVGQ
jgi:hypothetical protein